MITIQSKVFSIDHVLNKIYSDKTQIGAIVTFVGYDRDFGEDNEKKLIAMEVEHYPGMTEKVLQDIESKAKKRWKLSATEIIHRVGRLDLSEPIVCVAVASKHRDDAFEAARYIMDFLKTEAPFWKKEITSIGNYWVTDKYSDHIQKSSWNDDIEKI